jgi:hypothetical protein
VAQNEARLSTYLASFLLCQGIAIADALANMCDAASHSIA